MDNVLHFSAEVFAAKLCQFPDQLFGLRGGKGAGKEDAVDQHPEFRILKPAQLQEYAAFPGNLISHILQEHNIILDRLPLAFDTVVLFQQLYNFRFRQSVITVRILLQDFQNPHIQRLLVLQPIGIHTLTSLKCLSMWYASIPAIFPGRLFYKSRRSPSSSVSLAWMSKPHSPSL